MKKELILKLIELYCYVSAIYNSRLAYSVQRFSNAGLQLLAKANRTVILTTYKRKRGEKIVDSADSIVSTAISRLRQPIESLFNPFIFLKMDIKKQTS